MARDCKLKKPQMRLIPLQQFNAEKQQWAQKGTEAIYEPSSYHKRNPEVWNLRRPKPPRPDASKCEDLLMLSRHHGSLPNLLSEIRLLITTAFEKGTFSASIEAGWPSCIWAVTSDNQIAEAHRGTRGGGSYHGYPYTGPKDFEQEIRRRWNNP